VQKKYGFFVARMKQDFVKGKFHLKKKNLHAYEEYNFIIGGLRTK
jgi:hypothetical protein